MTGTSRTLPDEPHALPADEVLARLGVSADEGLADAEAGRRLKDFGANAVVATRKVSGLIILLHQFQSPVVYLLGAAAALAIYFGELEEGAAIVVVLAINALIGFFTELKAARSIEALRALGSHSTRVRRDGHVRLTPAETMVPGDIVVLEAGDAVSADLRLVEASNLAADESMLTGESVAVQKSERPVAADARLADRSSMLFKGTALTRGSGVGVVTATGLATELGRVSRLVAEAEPGSSPLEKRLARLSSQLVWAVLVLAVLIAGVGLTTGKDPLLMIEAAIALAVAAIPEGLPIVATLALARGMWRMARRNALIERLSAVETLGATTVILTDKTGTLTENRMKVRRLWTPGRESERVLDEDADLASVAGDARLRLLLEIGNLCNDASLDSLREQGSGDAMELALLRAGFRAGLKRSALLQRRPIIDKHAFDAATKMMATVHRQDEAYLFAVKGAPEAVLSACDRIVADDGGVAFGAAMRAEWNAHVEYLGRHGLRVLACAMKTAAQPGAPPYEGLTFLGLVGLEDPARADAPRAIRDCRDAGVRVVMVTGDHVVTARSIGRAVGLGLADHVLEGREVERVAGGDSEVLRGIGIFARVSPVEKLALVRAYQNAGEVVAMTGDGVNDAPALRQADIGVAMGLRGTDVAREAADMILLDDAFPTIVEAIREGRVIFGNIRRFAAYLLSCNLSEVSVVGLAVLSTLPLPLLPLQILYINLVTDVFPAFALAMGEGESDILRRPPRDPREPILGRRQWIVIMLQSLALTAGTFGALAASRLWLDLDLRSTTTVTFLTLGFAQIWHVFNMRDPRSDWLRNEVTRNRWVWGAVLLCAVLLAAPPYLPRMAEVMELTAPSPAMWAIVLGMSVAPLLATQAVTAAVAAVRSPR
jgi:Ca2+-transporting ATPase